MRIFFTGTTNKDYCMVNTATFKLANGSTITIDRDETDYSINDGELSMTWYGCYLWAVDNIRLFDHPAYLNESLSELLEDAELVSVEVEEDTDFDYMVNIIDWSV